MVTPLPPPLLWLLILLQLKSGLYRCLTRGVASLERGKLVKLVELNYLSAFEIWPKIRDGFFIDFMQASECFLTTIQEQVTIQ